MARNQLRTRGTPASTTRIIRSRSGNSDSCWICFHHRERRRYQMLSRSQCTDRTQHVVLAGFFLDHVTETGKLQRQTNRYRYVRSTCSNFAERLGNHAGQVHGTVNQFERCDRYKGEHALTVITIPLLLQTIATMCRIQHSIFLRRAYR